MALTPKQILGIIRTHKQKSDRDRKRWDRYKAMYQSRFFDNDRELPSGAEDIGAVDDDFIESNNSYAFIDTMIANICPLNPAITVNPRRKELAMQARGREALANDTMRRTKTHAKLWELATHASLYQRGFVKVVWDTVRQRPKLRVVDPRRVFFDLTAEDWDEIRYIIEVTVVPESEFKRRVGRKMRDGRYDKDVAERALFAGYPDWLRDGTNRRSMLNEASKDVFQWVTVYEVYDFTDPNGKFYHFLEDVETPLFADELPYRYAKNPFYMLTFNENMDDIGGLSDIQLIESAQEQLNELDTLELNHAKASVPTMLFNNAAVRNPEELKDAYMQSGQPGSFIGVDLANSENRITDVMMPSPVVSLSPSFAEMKGRCLEIIQYTLGIPDYSRGAIGGSDIATEVALADTAQRTRNGRRQKCIYNVVEWYGRAIIGLYAEFLDNEAALYVRLTGEGDSTEVTRHTMGMGSEESPLDYDFEAVPYSSMENNKSAQLKNIQSTWEALMWGVEQGTVDSVQLMAKMLEILELKNVLSKEPPPPEQVMAAQAGGLPGMAPPTADTIETGALPVGVEPAGVPMASGGAGAGEQTPVVRGTSGLPEVM